MSFSRSALGVGLLAAFSLVCADRKVLEPRQTISNEEGATKSIHLPSFRRGGRASVSSFNVIDSRKDLVDSAILSFFLFFRPSASVRLSGEDNLGVCSRFFIWIRLVDW